MGLASLSNEVKKDEEIGDMLNKFIDDRNAGQNTPQSNYLASASSDSVAKEADELLDVADILMSMKKKK